MIPKEKNNLQDFNAKAFEFEDPKIACNWLVNRYFDWLDGDVEIKGIKLGYKVFHNRVYIGFINYSPFYGEWVATSYPDRFLAKSLTQHQSEFALAVEFIVNEYLRSDLSPNLIEEPRELTN